MKFYDIDKCRGLEYSEDAFLFEKSIENVHCLDVFLVNDEYYSIGMASTREPKCAVYKLDKLDLDLSLEEHDFNIVCPICGYVDKDSFEMSEEYNDDYECGRCGAVLQVQQNVEITYDTYVKELPDIKEI